VVTWGRAVPVVCVLFLFAAVVIAPAGASTGDGAAQASKKRKCPKGKRLVVVRKNGKVVRKNGKPVRKCVKRRSTPKPATPGPLFDPPGQKLEGEAAKPFLLRYLANSTFTDCPAGFPACSVENLYSHTETTYRYCRLTMTSGADIINPPQGYAVDAAVVNPDGSWAFRERVENYSNVSAYEWEISADGVVRGAYQFQPNSEIEQIGPLQYVSGARDCSF